MSIKGILAVIANYGVGKTTFALENGSHPKDIVFINDDIKSVPFEGEYKKYVDLVSATKDLKILDFHQYILEMIDKLPEAKVLIWDTWTRTQSSFPAYVKANPNLIRNAAEYSSMGKIKVAEQYNDAYLYEGQTLTKLREKFDLVILTFHTKQRYENNVAVPDSQKPGHDKAIMRYADFRVWLTPNPHNEVPVGLILKNIARYGMTDNGIKSRQVFPLRVETCDWETLYKYWDDPIGNREPESNEMPDEFELALIEGVLTTEEKRMYEVAVKMVERESKKEDAENELIAMQELQNKARELAADSKPIPLIVKELSENGESVTIGQVAQWVK